MGSLAGQLERSTPLMCEYCGAGFVAKNKNGKKKKFCSRACKDRLGNSQRLKGAALLKDKQAAKRGPSRHAQKVSRFVFLSMVPVDQRADLLRQAAINLGITEEGEVLKALRRNGCPTTQNPELSTQNHSGATA